MVEATGIYVLVFVGCGAIVVDGLNGGRVSQIGIALTFGLSLGMMISAVGHVSGTHFNPVVSHALGFQGTLPFQQVIPYRCSHVEGGLLAVGALRFLFRGPISGA